MPNAYNQNDRPQFNGRFTRIDTNALYDPDTVQVTFLDQFMHAIVSYTYGVDPEVERVSTGWYRVYEPIQHSGCWLHYRFEGFDALGRGMGAGEHQCWCRRSDFY